MRHASGRKLKLKRLIYIFFLLVFCTVYGQADTLDYWHVYLNHMKIKEFNQNGRGRQEIILKRKDLKPSDIITLKYYSDTPCEDCITYLTLENGRHFEIDRVTGKGTLVPVSFSLNKVLQSKIAYLEVYYFDERLKGRATTKIVFRIKIE